MELPQRKGEDRFLASGRYRWLERTLRGKTALSEVRSLVVFGFDRRTRMLPFVYLDWYMVPCGARSIAGALYDAGMEKTRLVYQLWNPRVRPSRARIDGAPMDMLLVSAVQLHTLAAYQLIEDAWTMGEGRPLILAGGPKACYEPFDFFGLGEGQAGADVVVTGEESVLLELLEVIADFGGGQGRMREAFDRAREAGALRGIPGLVYPADGRHDGRNLVNTGGQRLLRELDDLPMATAGFRTLEGPHRKEELAREPLGLENACRGDRTVATLLVTRGCKFACAYCPIPSYNQRSFRHKSAERVVDELVDCQRQMGTRYFFGTDDNFFNSRKFTRELLEAMASKEIDGRPLRRRIRFRTESTVIDLYRNRDLLPLARDAGVTGIWMGVEDLSARLIDKGQGPGMTEALFGEMIAKEIKPSAMLMHDEAQPLHSPGKLTGLVDQVRFLFKAGAVTVQCTLAMPAVGTKWMDEAYVSGLLYEGVGGRNLEDMEFDGNHVIACRRSDPWRLQLDLLRGYLAFYNPLNLLRTFTSPKVSFRRPRVDWQLWGMISLARTAWGLKEYVWRLWRGPIRRHSGWPARFRRPGTPYPLLIDSDPSMSAGVADEEALSPPVSSARR